MLQLLPREDVRRTLSELRRRRAEPRGPHLRVHHRVHAHVTLAAVLHGPPGVRDARAEQCELRRRAGLPRFQQLPPGAGSRGWRGGEQV